MKKLFLIPALALCGMLTAQATDKISLTISAEGYANNSDAVLSASVDENYKLTVQLPDAETAVTGVKATATLTLTDIDLLGISGTKTATKTIDKGEDFGIGFQLGTYLSNLYGLETLTVSGDVTVGTTTKSVSATTATKNGNTLTATPNKDEVNAVMDLVRTQISKMSSTEQDGYVYVAAGSYIQYGDERITLNDGMRLFDGSASWNLITVLSEAYDKGYEKLDLTGKDSYVMELFATAGTKINYAGRQAVLNNDVTITLDLSNGYYEGADDMTGRFTAIRNLDNVAGEMREKAALLMAFAIADAVVGDLSNAEVISAKVVFGAEETEEIIFRENLTAGNYYTFTCDRDLLAFEGAELYDLAEYDAAAQVITLVAAESMPVAGKPYIAVANANEIKGIAKTDVEILTTGTVVNGLYGVLESQTAPTTVFNDNINRMQVTQGDYVIQNNQYHKAGAQTYLRKYTAYLKLEEIGTLPASAMAGKKRLVIGASNVATDAELLDAEVPTNAAAQKTIGTDGNLYIIKGGAMYNAQGQTVK